MTMTDDFAAIAALDLAPIKAKLMNKETGKGWTEERAAAVEREYRRFLYLMKLFPHEQTAPLVDVDKFWHCHILDTVKYAADCELLFNRFLHHNPYLGLVGADAGDVHRRAGQRMGELYESTFGEDYPGNLKDNAGNRPASTAFCGAATARTAFCGAAVSGATAFCGVAPPKTAVWGAAGSGDTAFCGAATQKLAFCGAADSATTAYSVPCIGAHTALRGMTGSAHGQAVAA